MSSSYAVLAGTDTIPASRATLNGNFDALLTCFSGTTAPSSPVAGQFWLHSGTLVLSQYNGSAWIVVANITSAGGNIVKADGSVAFTADQSLGGFKLTNLAAGTSANDAVRKAQVDAVVHAIVAPIGTISATGTFLLGALPQAVTISDVSVVTSASLTSSGTDRWEINVRNVTGAVDLKAADYDTNSDGDFTANQRNALGLDQNLTPSAGNGLRLDVTKNGSIGNLTDVVVVVEYQIAL